MSEVYVAFVRDDQTYAEALAVALQQAGFVVSRSASVVDAINKCAAIVVLWSPAAARSRLFVDAADRAYRSGKMVLVRLGQEQVPAMFASAEMHPLMRWGGDPFDPDVHPVLAHVDRLVTGLSAEARAAQGGGSGVVHHFPGSGMRPTSSRPPPATGAEGVRRPPNRPAPRVDPPQAPPHVDPPPHFEQPLPAAPAPADPLAMEAAFWRDIQGSKNPADFYAYLERFGAHGTFSEVAEARIRALSPKQPAPPQAQPMLEPPAASRAVSVSATAKPAGQLRLDPHPARSRYQEPEPASEPPRAEKRARPAPPADAAPKSTGGARGFLFVILLCLVLGGGYFALRSANPPTTPEGAEEENAAQADWTPPPPPESERAPPAEDGAPLAAEEAAPPPEPVKKADPARKTQAQAAPTRAEARERPRRPEDQAYAPPPAPTMRSYPQDPTAAAELLRDLREPEPAPPPAPAVRATPAPAPAPAPQVKWEQKPGARDIASVYPASALRRGMAGRVVLDCQIQSTFRAICQVASETPAGYGFGSAALRVANSFRAAPAASDGTTAAGKRARVSISFQPTE